MLSIPFYIVFALVLFLSPGVIFDIVAFFLLGLGNGVVSPSTTTAIQKYISREYLATVVGLNRTIYRGASIISVSLLGVLVTFFPSQEIYGGIALFLFLAFIIFAHTLKLEPPAKPPSA